MSLIDIEILGTQILQFIVDNMLVPGRIENWLILMDMEDLGVSNCPTDCMKTLMTVFFEKFPGRLFRCICINTSWLVRRVYDVVSVCLDEYTK